MRSDARKDSSKLFTQFQLSVKTKDDLREEQNL